MNELLNALTQLSKDIKELKELIKVRLKSQSDFFAELWLDNQDVSIALHLSKRTLQNLRDNGILPYSRIQNKFYYKVSDILALLDSNYYRNIKSRGKRKIAE